MSDAPKLSRRDWFRLQTPARKAVDGQAQKLGDGNSQQEGPSGLRAVEHPPNHDGMDLNELPPLREAILSEQDLAALFGDIERYGSDIQLMQKRGASNSHATVDAASSLRAAKELFANGKVNRLQIRYRWQESLWIDTLQRQESGIRLVRVSHQP